MCSDKLHLGIETKYNNPSGSEKKIKLKYLNVEPESWPEEKKSTFLVQIRTHICR